MNDQNESATWMRGIIHLAHPHPTHTQGDFNSFELAQKLKHYAPELDQAKAQVVCVGIGTVDGAKEFSKLVGFPLDKLYAVSK